MPATQVQFNHCAQRCQPSPPAACNDAVDKSLESPAPGVGGAAGPLNAAAEGLDAAITATMDAYAPHWMMLHEILEKDSAMPAMIEGAAAAHSRAARMAAAHALISNHENVLRDVANPSPDTNIDGKPLTQLELQRVDIGSAMYADQALRETARRLLGRRPGLHQLEVRIDPCNEQQAAAWAATHHSRSG